VKKLVVQTGEEQLQIGFGRQDGHNIDSEGVFGVRSNESFVSRSTSGLPLRIYLPIVVVLAAAFLALMAYLVADGFGVTGSVFGSTAKTGAPPSSQGAQNAVEGGPPPAVMAELSSLRARIASHPNDDVALTQLGDMYLAANKFSDAVPLYRRALKANPHNVAAQTGLEQAQDALHSAGQ
jgi:cytochrome c-type biogenesis protein CcmH/NrfG